MLLCQVTVEFSLHVSNLFPCPLILNLVMTVNGIFVNATHVELTARQPLCVPVPTLHHSHHHGSHAYAGQSEAKTRAQGASAPTCICCLSPCC